MRINGNVIPTPGKLREKIGLLKSSIKKINFGNIFYQQNATETIEIVNEEKTEISMNVINCPKYIKLEIEPKVIASGERGEIKVTFDSKLKHLYGSSTDNPKISMTMGERVLNGSIKIIANVIEDFSKLTAQELADAPIIYFPKRSINIGKVEEKETENIEIEFENRGKSELIIRNVEINNVAFILAEYDEVVAPGGKGIITVKTNPGYVSAALNTRVNVIANTPKDTKTILRLYGTKQIPKPDLKEGKNLQTKPKNIKVIEAYNFVEKYKNSDKLVILDVRTPKEYENGCLYEAINLNFEDKNFYKTIQLLDRSKMYLVYCKSGIRSEGAIEIMTELGFKNVLHMFNGMDSWQENRLKVSDPGM